MSTEQVNTLQLTGKDLEFVVKEAQRITGIVISQASVTNAHPAVQIVLQLVISQLLEKNVKARTNNIKWHSKNVYAAAQVMNDYFKFPGDEGYVDPRGGDYGR